MGHVTSLQLGQVYALFRICARVIRQNLVQGLTVRRVGALALISGGGAGHQSVIRFEMDPKTPYRGAGRAC